jgi:hypothetical protein
MEQQMDQLEEWFMAIHQAQTEICPFLLPGILVLQLVLLNKNCKQSLKIE